jgi:hypothetical protein
MLENKSMPPWFVACAQIVWATASADDKQAAVDEMIRRHTDDPEFRLPRIINAPNGDIYEINYDPFELRGAKTREDMEAENAKGKRCSSQIPRPTLPNAAREAPHSSSPWLLR